MSDDKDMREIRLQIEAMRKARSKRPENQLSFREEMQRLVDSEQPSGIPTMSRVEIHLMHVREWLSSKLFMLFCGRERPAMNLETKLFLDDLRAEKKLSQDEHLACAQWRIAGLNDDGVLEAGNPPQKLVLLGWLALILVAIALAYSLATFLNQFLSIYLLAFWGFPIGAVIGKLGRTIYYSTWGWKPLALKIRDARLAGFSRST